MSIDFTGQAYDDGKSAGYEDCNRNEYDGNMGIEVTTGCPWPINAPEGEAWIKGWNEAVIARGYPEEVR